MSYRQPDHLDGMRKREVEINAEAKGGMILWIAVVLMVLAGMTVLTLTAGVGLFTTIAEGLTLP